MRATNPSPRHWLIGGALAAFVLLLGWLLVGHVLVLADRKANDTAAKVASSAGLDAIARRPLVVIEVKVTRDPDGATTIASSVQVREECQGERFERRVLWPDGQSEQVEPAETSPGNPGSAIYSPALTPGTHQVWVRYHWPDGHKPLLYFVHADFREATCPSGFRGEYLVLYRELEPG